MDMIQEERRIIFNRKEIPKNNTKNKRMDTANWTIFNVASPYSPYQGRTNPLFILNRFL